MSSRILIFEKRENLLREKECAKILKEVGDNRRPDRAGAYVQPGEHGAVNRNQYKSGQTLISMAGTEDYRRNYSRDNPVLEIANQSQTCHEVAAKGGFFTESSRKGQKYPDNSAGRILRKQ